MIVSIKASQDDNLYVIEETHYNDEAGWLETTHVLNPAEVIAFITERMPVKPVKKKKVKKAKGNVHTLTCR